jgi:hypothetical protein
LLTVSSSWCPTCAIDYAGACAYDVLVDEGVGGRFVATFDCADLVAGDGTKESITGRIDGLHMRPPE